MPSNGNSYIKNALKHDCLDASGSEISFPTHCNPANRSMLILLQVKQETYNSIQLNRKMSDNLDAVAPELCFCSLVRLLQLLSSAPAFRVSFIS